MPDFEALIRHQQDQQPTTNKRLKIVDRTDFDNEKSEELRTTKSGLFFNFIGGFIGSIIVTLTILFLYINEYLPIDLLKLK